MRKIAFIMPGYGYSTKRPEYNKIKKLFKNQGIIPISVDIVWNYKTINHWVEKVISSL